MSDLVVFVAVVAAMAGVGMALGIIVAGRMDRLLASRASEPPAAPSAPAELTTPAELPDADEPPAAPAPSEENES